MLARIFETISFFISAFITPLSHYWCHADALFFATYGCFCRHSSLLRRHFDNMDACFREVAADYFRHATITTRYATPIPSADTDTRCRVSTPLYADAHNAGDIFDVIFIDITHLRFSLLMKDFDGSPYYFIIFIMDIDTLSRLFFADCFSADAVADYYHPSFLCCWRHADMRCRRLSLFHDAACHGLYHAWWLRRHADASMPPVSLLCHIISIDAFDAARTMLLWLMPMIFFFQPLIIFTPWYYYVCQRHISPASNMTPRSFADVTIISSTRRWHHAFILFAAVIDAW